MIRFSSFLAVREEIITQIFIAYRKTETEHKELNFRKEAKSKIKSYYQWQQLLQ